MVEEEDQPLGPQTTTSPFFLLNSPRLLPHPALHFTPPPPTTSQPNMRASTFLSFAALSLAAFVVAAPTPAIQVDAVAVAALEQVADSITVEVRGLTKKQKAAKAKVSSLLRLVDSDSVLTLRSRIIEGGRR